MAQSDTSYLALDTPRESQGTETSACIGDEGIQVKMKGRRCVGDLELEDPESTACDEALIAQRWRGQYALLCIFGFFCITLASICLLGLIATCMQTMSYLSWMLMSACAPIILAYQKLGTGLRTAYADSCFVVLHIRKEGSRDKTRYLLEAIQLIVRRTRPSGEAELIIEHEESTSGTLAWRPTLVPWKQQCSLQVERNSHVRKIYVEASEADPIICGPKHEIMRPQAMLLRIQSSSMWDFFTFVLHAYLPSHGAQSFLSRQEADMQFLQSWLHDLFIDHMRTTEGRVEVYDLQQDCKDWSPEWQRVRNENAIRGDMTQGAGSFAQYHVKGWAMQMLKYAEFATKHTTRMKTTLYLHGPKGSGKTVFVEWLASELGLPIYFIDLQSGLITDDVLRDALTPRRLKHNLPVIFHFDEFQSVIERWTSDGSSSVSAPQGGITIQGLQCVLEGISTPNNALFLFTGCLPLPDATYSGTFAQEWIGLLRRFTVQQEIPRITLADVAEFIKNFLKPYLPPGCDISPDNSIDWFQNIRTEWFLDEQDIPFDMIAKYCEQRLRDGYVRGLIVENETGMIMLNTIDVDGGTCFLRFAFASAALRTWVESYAGGKYARVKLPRHSSERRAAGLLPVVRGGTEMIADETAEL